MAKLLVIAQEQGRAAGLSQYHVEITVTVDVRDRRAAPSRRRRTGRTARTGSVFQRVARFALGCVHADGHGVMSHA